MPVFGGFLGDPKADAMAAQMAKAAELQAAYRPMWQDAQNQSLNNQLAMYQPANNALGEMYGPGAQVDLQQAGQQVMDPAMQDLNLDPNDGRPGKNEKKRRTRGALAGFILTGGPFGAVAGAARGKEMGRRKDKRKKGKKADKAMYGEGIK